MAVISPQPHGATLILDPLLFFQQADHRVRGAGIEFGTVGILEPTDRAGKIDHGTLQPQADAQERDLLLPSNSG